MATAQGTTSITMSDMTIAADLMAMAKADAALLTMSCLETIQPQLRGFFQESLNRCINAQGQLAQMAEAKGWYHASLEPTEQLKQDLKFVSSLQNA